MGSGRRIVAPRGGGHIGLLLIVPSGGRLNLQSSHRIPSSNLLRLFSGLH